MVESGAPAAADMYSADGHIREVVYLGMHTRYLVALAGGGELMVVAQNLDGSAVDAHAAAGRACA